MYRSPNIVRVIKYRRLRWADQIVRMEEGRNALKNLISKSIGKGSSGWEVSVRINL